MINEFRVSASPHIRSGETTATIMRDVMIALTPAALFGIYRFGFRAFLILLLSVTSCVLSEHLYKKVRKLSGGGYECSAMVTGLLLGMMLPVNVPYWLPVLGGVFAIVVVKMLFGGLGRNILNPALAARELLLLLAGRTMTDLTVDRIEAGSTSLYELFLGFTGGAIGETSAFLLLLGGLYLILRHVISIWIPATYILSFVLFMGLCGGQGFDGTCLAEQVFGGGLMLGAFFLATDYVTSPVTPAGKIVFGLLLGLLTGMLRVIGSPAEEVSVAILSGNLLVPLIERLTLPKAFGKNRSFNFKKNK